MIFVCKYTLLPILGQLWVSTQNNLSKSNSSLDIKNVINQVICRLNTKGDLLKKIQKNILSK